MQNQPNKRSVFAPLVVRLLHYLFSIGSRLRFHSVLTGGCTRWLHPSHRVFRSPLNVANLVNVCKFDDFFANLVNFHELGQFLWFLAIFTFFWQIWWIWLNYAKMRLIFANLGNFSEFGKLDLGPKVYSRKDQILWIWQGWGHWISKVSRNRRNDKISWKWK